MCPRVAHSLFSNMHATRAPTEFGKPSNLHCGSAPLRVGYPSLVLSFYQPSTISSSVSHQVSLIEVQLPRQDRNSFDMIGILRRLYIGGNNGKNVDGSTKGRHGVM